MCNKQKFWPVLCEKLGRPEWSDDPRFATFEARLENRAELTALLDDALAPRGTETWLAHFAGEVPAAPVHDIARAFGSEFVTREDRVWGYDHHPAGEVRMVAPAFRIPGEDMPRRAAPALGADTDAGVARDWLWRGEDRGVAREGCDLTSSPSLPPPRKCGRGRC